jgi:lipopolysaccharide biosynthesis regulator YciM
LQPLIGTRYDTQALVLLLGLYERTREWGKASHIAQQLEGKGEGQFSSRVTHHLCEQAQELRQRSPAHWTEAEQLLRTALHADPNTPRVKLELAEILEKTERPAEAWQILHTLARPELPVYPLAVPLLVRLAPVLGLTADLTHQLEAAQRQTPSIDYTDALARLSPDTLMQQQRYLQHLAQEPSSLLAAHAWLLAHPSTEQPPAAVLQALDRSCIPLRRYRCSACGFEASHHFWQCPGCQSWDSYSPHRIEEL